MTSWIMLSTIWLSATLTDWLIDRPHETPMPDSGAGETRAPAIDAGFARP